MVQVGNYNYSDYYSSGAYAPREGTLSYAEFDPDAYLTARPDVLLKILVLRVRVSTSLPACSCSSMVERLPAMKHYMRIIKVYTLVTPSNRGRIRSGTSTSNRTLTFSADQNQTYQQSKDIRLLGVPWANTRQVYQHS
jgi:hypothetical protein